MQNGTAQATRVALVTGCGGGIGWATVNGLLRRQWHVLGVTRDRKRFDTTRSSLPENLFIYELDARSAFSESFHALLARHVLDWMGLPRINLLISNAAVCPPDWDAASLQEAFAVNVLFPQSIYEAFRYLDSRHAPEPCSVINVSSGDGELCFFTSVWRSAIERLESWDDLFDFMFMLMKHVHGGNLRALDVVHGHEPAYRLSKALLNRLTIIQARAAPKHIRVDAICPGDVQTKMNPSREARLPAAAAEDIIQLAEYQRRSLCSSHSEGRGRFWRFGQPISF